MRARRNWLLLSASALLIGSCTDSTSPGPLPAKLAFLVQPQATGAGIPINPPIEVALQDASGQTLTTSNGTVTLALGANPGHARLAGSTSVKALNGVATFRGLSLGVSDTGYTLTASSQGVPMETSDTFSIIPGPAARLAFGTQPASGTAGDPINPAVTVRILDAFGNPLTTSTLVVALTLVGTPGAILSGTTSVMAVNGTATFSDLSVQQAGVLYTLAATSTGVPSVSSNTFNILPASPARLVFSVEPAPGVVGLPLSPAVQVSIQDAYGNAIPSATNAVTLALGANPGNATLSGTLTTNAVGGVASFGNLKLDQPASGYTLAATSGALTVATSGPFNMLASGVLGFVREDQDGNHRGIAVMTTVGSNIVSLTGTGESPVWSPDGTRIAFLSGGSVTVMNADGSGQVNLQLGLGSSVTGLAWKPDGSRLAFSGSYNYSSGLFLMAPDGSNVTRIVAGPGAAWSPSWSPDGTRLVLICPPQFFAGLCLVNADGSGLTQLAPSGVQPTWKPDGTQILYVGSGLTLINPDGSGASPLGVYGLLPAWSGDGQQMAFVVPGGCLIGGGSSSSGCFSFVPDSIRVANADGSGSHAIAAGTAPAWKP